MVAAISLSPLISDAPPPPKPPAERLYCGHASPSNRRTTVLAGNRHRNGGEALHPWRRHTAIGLLLTLAAPIVWLVALAAYPASRRAATAAFNQIADEERYDFVMTFPCFVIEQGTGAMVSLPLDAARVLAILTDDHLAERFAEVVATACNVKTTIVSLPDRPTLRSRIELAAHRG